MSLLLTRTQNVRSSTNLDKYEFRASRYGCLDAFMNQSQDPDGILTEEMKQKAMTSIGSTMEVPVIDYDAGVTIGNTRTLTIADDENTSRMVTITFATYAWGFTVTPSLFHNNEVKIQEDFEKKMRKYENKFLETLDTTAEGVLNTNKTQVLTDPLQYLYQGDVVQATYAEREELIGNQEALQFSNDYFDQQHLVGNQGLMSIIGKLEQEGVYNARNRQLEYLGKVLHYSKRVSNPVGRYATFYTVNKGSLGMLSRFEREVLYRRKTNIGYEWDLVSLPDSGIDVGAYYYEAVVDGTSIAGAASADMDRVFKEHYGFAVDIAFLTAYNSDSTTKPDPIIKNTINTSTTDADTTAPSVSSITSTALTAMTINFSEVMCSDANGTILSGDIASDMSLTVATPGASITSATVAADGQSIDVVLVSTNLAASDTIEIDVALYDGAGNTLAAATSLAQVNAGATAWEVIP